MGNSSSFSIVFSCLVLFLLFNDPCDASGEVQVDVINDLGDRVLLIFNCWSKNRDLGKQILQNGEKWGFKTGTDLQSTASCRFVWAARHEWFDVFVPNRDSDVCKDQACVWMIRSNGPCRLNSPEKCFPWKEESD